MEIKKKTDAMTAAYGGWTYISTCGIDTDAIKLGKRGGGG